MLLSPFALCVLLCLRQISQDVHPPLICYVIWMQYYKIIYLLLLEIWWTVDGWDRGTCDLVAREYPLQPALSLTTWWETREKPRWTIHQQFLRTPELLYNWLISVKMAILSLKLPIFSCQAIQLQLKMMKNSETNFQQTMQKTWKFTFIAKTGQSQHHVEILYWTQKQHSFEHLLHVGSYVRQLKILE